MPENEEPTTPEAELARARDEIGAGNVAHALRHLAVALSLDPLRAHALDVLDQALDRAGDRALDLLGIEEDMFFGIAALRAFALARRDSLLEALVILFEVARFRPDIPYLVWARGWFTTGATRERGDEVTPDQVGACAVSFVEPLSRESAEDEGVRQNLEATLVVLEKLRASHPEAERLTFAAILTLRRLGRRDEAIALGRAWRDAKPSWISTVTLANAYREQGAFDEAIALYRCALALRPKDVSPLLDSGDLLLEAGRFEEAARVYGEVLAKSPHDLWAEPSRAFACYLTTKEERWRKELNELAARSPEGSRARKLCDELRAQAEAPVE